MTGEITEDRLEHILKQSIKDELSGPVWPVYEHYEVAVDDDEVFVIAPLLEHWVPVDETSKWHGGSRLEVRNQAVDARFYLPLRTPELVVDLAYLAEKGIGAEVVLRWANKYGLLGFPKDDLVEATIGGAPYQVRGERRRDNVARFAEAAGEVMACLRAYEIVTNEEESLDPETLGAYLNLLSMKALRPWERRAGEERRWSLRGVGNVVQARLTEHCYPKLSHYPDGRFALSYGFKNLLGAIWLQMAWLLSAEGSVTRCALPTCFKVITFGLGEQPPLEAPKGARGKPKTYANKKYCNHNCAAKYSYRKSRGWRGYV
jgi:hypothetical protein